MYTYSVFIEMIKNKKHRISAIANNIISRNEIPASIVSRGRYYNCLELQYDIKVPLENGGFLVYIINGKKEDYEEDSREILPMYIKGEKPTVDDFYIYKTLSSANTRVKDLNDQLKKEGINAEAVCFEFKTNEVY
jgi:hypothetical protein